MRTAEQIVADILDQHRLRPNSLTCKALDWTYDGDNDHDEHVSERIVAALGLIAETADDGVTLLYGRIDPT